MNVEKIIHFLHIGKTGGTAIKHALAGCSGNQTEFRLHAHNIRLSDIPNGEKVFFFLRDPISRFVSGFYSRKRKGMPRYFYDWSHSEAEAFENFTTANELAGALSSNDKKIIRDAINAMRSIQHLKDSYWYWFINRDYFLSRLNDIIFIGWQERLAQDFDILLSNLSISCAVNLPDSEFNAHRNPAQLDKDLDNDAINNLKAWYKKDYEFIDLCILSKKLVLPTL